MLLHVGVAQCTDTAPFVSPPDSLIPVDTNRFNVVPYVRPVITDTVKGVFFVHGLGGNSSTLGRMATATEFGVDSDTIIFPARKAVTYNVDYSDMEVNHSLLEAADQVNDQMADATLVFEAEYGVDRSTQYAIASSQGGIVSRRLDKLYEDDPIINRYFNGLVTFGTAHQGAYIINSNQSGAISDLAVEMCDRLTGGYSADATDNFWLRLFNIDTKIEDLRENVCGVFGETILPALLGRFNAVVTKDYAVGAAPIESLNQFDSPLQKVAFYGTETDTMDGIFFRIMHSIVNDPSAEPTFTANEDIQMIKDSEDLYFKFLERREKAKQAYRRRKENRRLICGPIPNLCWLAFKGPINEAKDREHAWNEGLLWFNKINDDWKTIIGARELKKVNAFICNCDGSKPYSTLDALKCAEDGCTPVPAGTKDVITEQESDGIVTASSAKQWGQFREMEHSNHMQMKNDGNTKDRLIELYRGDYGRFFKLSTK